MDSTALHTRVFATELVSVLAPFHAPHSVQSLAFAHEVAGLFVRSPKFIGARGWFGLVEWYRRHRTLSAEPLAQSLLRDHIPRDWDGADLGALCTLVSETLVPFLDQFVALADHLLACGFSIHPASALCDLPWFVFSTPPLAMPAAVPWTFFAPHASAGRALRLQTRFAVSPTFDRELRGVLHFLLGAQALAAAVAATLYEPVDSQIDETGPVLSWLQLYRRHAEPEYSRFRLPPLKHLRPLQVEIASTALWNISRLCIFAVHDGYSCLTVLSVPALSNLCRAIEARGYVTASRVSPNKCYDLDALERIQETIHGFE